MQDSLNSSRIQFDFKLTSDLISEWMDTTSVYTVHVPFIQDINKRFHHFCMVDFHPFQFYVWISVAIGPSTCHLSLCISTHWIAFIVKWQITYVKSTAFERLHREPSHEFTFQSIKRSHACAYLLLLPADHNRHRLICHLIFVIFDDMCLKPISSPKILSTSS
jgi:hypothetical protein